MKTTLAQKENARRLTKIAIYHGEILKKPCEVCEDEHSECHHVDYSDPMNIQWLCKTHHFKAHMSQREIQRQEKIREDAEYIKLHPVPKTAAEVLLYAREAQATTRHQIGTALGVSSQQIKDYETCRQVPDRTRIADWIESDVPWVRQLGLAVFGAQFGALIRDVLVPDTE